MERKLEVISVVFSIKPLIGIAYLEKESGIKWNKNESMAL